MIFTYKRVAMSYYLDDIFSINFTIRGLYGSIVFSYYGQGFVVLETPNQALRLYFYYASIYKRFVHAVILGTHAVNSGWYVELYTLGIGFRFKRIASGRSIIFFMGRSAYIVFHFHRSIRIQCHKRRILICSHDKQKLFEVIRNVRRIRIPDSFRGKGLKMRGEVSVLKEGKRRQR